MVTRNPRRIRTKGVLSLWMGSLRKNHSQNCTGFLSTTSGLKVHVYESYRHPTPRIRVPEYSDITVDPEPYVQTRDTALTYIQQRSRSYTLRHRKKSSSLPLRSPDTKIGILCPVSRPGWDPFFPTRCPNSGPYSDTYVKHLDLVIPSDHQTQDLLFLRTSSLRSGTLPARVVIGSETFRFT